MKVKRWLPWMTAALAALALSVVAAGYGKTEAAPAAADAKAGAGLRVGLVTDIGGLNDRGFNQLANTGLKRAQSELGVQGRVLVSRTNADYIPNLTSLARGGYDVVIGVGFLMAEAMNTVSQRFPDTRFGIIDVDWNSLKAKPKNVQGLLFKEQEVGYLAGYLAALTAKENGRVVSSVGGLKIPPVDHFIAGYQAGAKRAVPGTKTLNGYSQDFVDQAKCKEIALEQIAQGSRVVFQVAGGCGLGALDAAREKGVKGIGVDADQARQGRHVLTSALKRVDSAVFLAVKAAQADAFRGGTNAIFGLKEGGVGLGKTQGAFPAHLKAVRSIESQIKSGKIKNIPTVVR